MGEINPPTAGVTLVGDSVLPSVGEEGALAPVAPHAEVVEAEGPAPVQAPGVLLATATAWLFRPGQEPTAVAPRDVPELITLDGAVVWVDLPAYDASDLHEIARLLGLHRKAVHAALSPWQRPRLAVYPDHFFISATIARLDPSAYRVGAGELDLFVGRAYVVSSSSSQ